MSGYPDEVPDPLPDTDELVVPVWRILRGPLECDPETITSSQNIATATPKDKGIAHARVVEALKFLEEEGYATVGRGGWKATDGVWCLGPRDREPLEDAVRHPH